MWEFLHTDIVLPLYVFYCHTTSVFFFFLSFQISNNTEYLRTQMSQKLRKALQANGGQLHHITQFVGTLPGIIDHNSHDIGEVIILFS